MNTYMRMIFGARPVVDCAGHGMKLSQELCMIWIELAVLSDDKLVFGIDLLFERLWHRGFQRLSIC